MGNDRDEKFDGHEESEYHFSDEEVSYEVENETPKKAAAPSSGSEQKESIISRLTGSKRMLVSLGVFLVLVFVVYKIVSPTTSTPPSEITAAPVVAQQNTMPKNPPVTSQAQNQPAAPVVPSPATMAQNANQPAVATQQPAEPAAAAPAQAPSPMPIPPSGASLMPSAQQLPTAAPVTVPTPGAQQAIMAQQGAQPAIPAQQQNPAEAMPGVIPIQAPVPPSYINQPTSSAATAYDVKATALTADTERLMSQFQANYTQKFNEYATQNKALQEQVQSLNARVATMENHLNQLIQVLTRQQSISTNPAAAVPAQAEQPKVSYNVQAIIPGRAWLKSENGETFTVAEGDVIKNLGRVTKIDPYDGLVEINTGYKAISLSYGTGG